jgi:hypothetical protein
MEQLTEFINEQSKHDQILNTSLSTLRPGFSFAYVNLLQSIAKNDLAQISSICEKTLYREFYSGLQDINFNYKSIEVLNVSEDDDQNIENIKLSVFGMQSIFGAQIEREQNRLSGLRRVQSSRKSLSCFVPDNIEWGDLLPMNVQFKIRVETNIKL